MPLSLDTNPYVVQLYLPSDMRVNKDFLKQVLNDEKKLLAIKDCRFINVPKYDELSVKNIFPRFKDDAQMMQYFPDAFPKDKGPTREYFFTVLNTVHPEYLDRLVAHANKQRFGSNQSGNQTDEIQMTTEWWEKLNALPYFSSK